MTSLRYRPGMADKPIAGDHAQHVANGMCPSLHENAGKQYMCQGVAGHYSWFTNRHWARGIDKRTGTFALEWV